MYTSGKFILVITGSLTGANDVSSLLTREGYSVKILVQDSFDLKTLNQSSPDLILVDIDIAEKNTKSLFHELRTHTVTIGIPILYLNRFGNSDTAKKALQYGCYDFVMMPSNDLELLTRINTQLELNAMRMRLEYVNLALEESVMNRTRELEESNLRLRVSEERWQYALEGNGDGVWDWNLKTNEVFFSRRWKEMLGYKEDDMWDTYEEWTKHIHPDDVGWVTDVIQMHLSGNTSSYESEHRVICKDGEYIWVLSRGKVISSVDGKPSRMVGTHTDISERKKIETNLQKAKAEAEIANRLKSQFLANMSHEIRTPMNAILGFAEILKDKVGDNDELLEYLSGIQKSGNNLIHLINDILDIAKIEAGRLEIVYSPVNLNSIISDIKQIFSIQTAQKKLKFEVTIDDNLPRSMFLDELRLRQVLFNVIGNAVKFTEKGGVDVNVRGFLKDANHIDLLFEITDTGIGISKSDMDTIFEPFKQQQEQGSGGFGLGLSIARRLVEMMKGKITFQSQKGKGSKFTIAISDIAIASVRSEKKIEKKVTSDNVEFNSANILLVEDNEANRQVDNSDLTLQDFLEKLEVLLAEQKLPREFIHHYKIWHLDSEIARKSLNTNRLKTFILDLKTLSETYNVEDFVSYANYLIQLINSFAIGKLSIALDILEQIYGRLK